MTAVILALSALLIAAQASSPPPLHGGPQQVVCPIGGERFEALETTHYSTMGSRPDGRPNTYWYMPLPIPTCPTNGLVVFMPFDAEQIAALTPLIASAEYRDLMAHDSTYYRAQWLATRIGLPERAALWMLLQATWQVKPLSGETGQPMPSAEKARQYQEEFVHRVRALPAEPRDEEYFNLYARAANAARELGRFEEARAMLAQFEAWATDEDMRGFARSLSAVVERRDSSIEPIDMMADHQAASRCLDAETPTTPFEAAFCRRPELREEIEDARRNREIMQARPPESR